MRAHVYVGGTNESRLSALCSKTFSNRSTSTQWLPPFTHTIRGIPKIHAQNYHQASNMIAMREVKHGISRLTFPD